MPGICYHTVCMDDKQLITLFHTDPEAGYRALLEQYSDVILRMIRRFLQDQDEVMEVYTYICERLRANDFSALRRFRDTSGILPWLSVVAANACRDRFRKTRASSSPRSVIDQLDEREQLVFRYYYQEHRRHGEIAELIDTQHGLPCTKLDVIQAIGRIDDLLTTGRRWFLLAALHANKPSYSLEVLREETGYQPVAVSDVDGFEEATQRKELLDRLKAALEQLRPSDQLLVQLRFEHGMTAPQIARIMQYDNHRRVYTRLRTVFNQLRKLLEGG